VLSCRVASSTITSTIVNKVNKEHAVSQPGPEPSTENPAPTATEGSWTDVFGRVGVDWAATIVAGVITLLAVANVLPKIPW
jgi:hypothetical protein